MQNEVSLACFVSYVGYALYYRKRGSASYIVREVLSVRERERERDTEKDGSDVTIVALKLAMSVHFPLPKIRTFRFSLYTSRLSLGHHCGAEIRNEFTLLGIDTILRLGLYYRKRGSASYYRKRFLYCA